MIDGGDGAGLWVHGQKSMRSGDAENSGEAREGSMLEAQGRSDEVAGDGLADG
jgi:hypothetical protein